MELAQKAITTGIFLAGLAFSAHTQAATIYAASITEISNFGITAQNGTISLSGFTFSNSAAADDTGNNAASVDLTDANASCIGACSSWNNQFYTHFSTTSPFIYGDARVSNNTILTGSGSASSIAEAGIDNGFAYAAGSNTMNASLSLSQTTSLNFGFLLDNYLEVTGNGAGIASMSVDISLTNGLQSWSWALNPPLTTVGLDGTSILSQSFSTSTSMLNAGTYSLAISMENMVNVSAVPIPAALPLMLTGLVGLFGLAKKRKA